MPTGVTVILEAEADGYSKRRMTVAGEQGGRTAEIVMRLHRAGTIRVRILRDGEVDESATGQVTYSARVGEWHLSRSSLLKSGATTISGLQAGTRSVSVPRRLASTPKQEVTVGEGEETTVDFEAK